MKKIKNANFDVKMRIISVIFIFAVLTTCIVAYIRTYSEYVSNPNNLNGVIGNTIYINDADEDWYYYMGQNYSYSSNGILPTFADKGIYNDTNLVETQITYSGTDIIYEDTGYTSLSEQQSNYVYYKYYPVYDNGTTSTSDDYILIELIDNPYTDRPDDLGFNGWITSYQGVTTSYDSVYYERYAKVPVTYANSKPSKITITFNAGWTAASVGTMTSSWNNAFASLKDAGMEELIVYGRIYDYNYYMDDYYTQTTISRYTYYEGYYDYYGTLYTSGSGYCTSRRGCTVYEKMTGQLYNSNTTYYEVSSGYMQILDPEDIPFSYTDGWADPFSASTIMAGFYREETIDYGVSLYGYYNSSGEALSGTCSSTTCTAYKLIQYHDSDNNVELADINENYYYLVTRDTNIIYMNSNVSGSWSTSTSNYTRPFTLTSLHNGTKANITWTTSSASVNCYANTRIENLTINDGTGYMANTSPTSNAGSTRYIYGNYHNLKIGRGIAKSSNNGTAIAVIGGDNNATGYSTIGSTSNPKKYKLIIESGFYSSLAMTNGASGNTSSHNTIYVAAKAIYGNDYDRIINNNDGLIVYYCASGSWRGQYHSTSNTAVMFDLIVKSGQYGSGKYDDTAGIYVGGRMGGTHYAAKRAKVEGGVIYSLIGGPLTASSQADYNDTYIAVTGGTIDMIIGGAGQTATYGNRLVQVTGGTINYSVFGGSNGSDGSSGDGTVNGDSFIYIGGLAIIGDSTLVSNNSTSHGAEAGSVFGIGNGNSSDSTIGSSDNSYVIIADSAIVRRSVYGGGNYGATGVSSTANTTTSKIKIIGGTINDSVYGGGNNNGSGDSSTTSTINIEMSSGTVNGSIYGGSNISGTVYGSTTVNIYGGSVLGSIYGGGKGGNANSYGTAGTYVSGATNVVVGHHTINTYTGPVVSGSVYGGSAYGTVGGTASNNTYTNNDTSVTVNRGTITGSVFGGGQGSSTYTPYVKGDVVVDINGGTIGNVYGGCDLAGSPSGTVTVYIDGGAITSCVYGGGNQAGVDVTNVYLRGGTVSVAAYGGSNEAGATTTNVSLEGATVTSIFGGSNASGTVNESNITTSSGTVGTIYGGNNSGGTTTTTNITTNGGTITTIYGGGKGITGGDGSAASAGTTHVTLNSSNNTITSVFGGGQSSNANETHVTLSGANATTIYGGSDTSGTVGASYVITSSGTVGTIYGGNNAGGTTTTTNITTNGGTITTIYGGGKGITGGDGSAASAGTTHVTLNSSNNTITSVFGGGQSSNANETHAALSGTNVTTIYGGSDISGTVGTSYVTVSSGTAGTIYGGNNAGGTTNITNVTTTGGTITDIYGGGKGVTGGNGSAASAGRTTVNLASTTILGSVYGGGSLANVIGATAITINNTTVSGNVFGGGDEAKVGTTVTLGVENSTITGSIYGGGNAADVTGIIATTINNTDIGGSIYGGGNEGVAESNVTLTILNGSSITGSVYGGGNQAAVNGITTTSVTNSSVGVDVYGGGNAGIVTSNANLTLSTATVTGSVYGGGNLADVNGLTNVIINNSSNIGTNVYGGGNAAEVGTTVTLSVTSSTIIGSLYGGGNEADVTGIINTTINNTDIGGNVYGGGNKGEAGSNVSLTINNGSEITGSIYGGGNLAAVAGSTSITMNSVTAGANVFGGGNEASVGTTSTLSATDSTITGSLYGGGNAANVTGIITSTLNNTDVGSSIYGGGNEGAALASTNLTITNGSSITGSVYGGGNAANVTGTATTNISNSTISIDVYGGGNAGSVGGNANLTLNTDTISGSVYGGGYGTNATVTGSADVNLVSTSVTGNVFGGGNAGTVNGSTDLYISSGNITGNVYGGGNGVTAVVLLNNLLNIDGTTIISGNVYGGGNAAATGNELNNNGSSGIINIAGGTISGDVYGGARTSVLYGTSYVNIGINAVSTTGLISGDISIGGTVFGGGDAKPIGSDVYTFDFISVKNGATVTIDGSSHTNFSINGSLFGSGNASSINGTSTLYIKNYGTLNNCKYNISIQRANVAIIDNSCIELEGAADRTQELKETPYTFSLIDSLTIKNNTTLYLQTITNKLASFTSAADTGGANSTETLAAVTINEQTGAVSFNTTNSDNRLYIWAGENVNISPDAFVDTVTGPVFGMTFFGRYDHDRDDNIYSAYYDSSFTAGDTATTGELNYFSEGSYVKGLHKRLPNYAEQNITVDGFYTNQENKDNPGVIETVYIQPELVGQNQEHYIWTVGEGVTKLTVDLTASKYSTLGGQVLTLDSFYKANTTFTILGFYYNDYDPNANLIASSTIPRIASTSTIADNNMGLVMRTGNSGWLNSGTTEYFTSTSNPYSGTTYYESDNSSIAPSLYFYLYHSKNLGTAANMGTVTISLLVVTPINLIESSVQRVNIEVSISRVLIAENYYDAAITSGQQYEMFMTTPTTIDSKSSFSTYYSLYAEEDNSIYQTGYYRALTSNYALPENTRITMIDYFDMDNPEYYYYVVTASDETAALAEIAQQGEASYNLSSFIQMGSINTGSTATTYHYDDVAKNAIYYDSNTGLAIEEFIFIVDFSEADIQTNKSNLSLLIDLRRVVNGSIASVFGVNNEIGRLIVYDVYANSSATIDVSSTLTPSTVYLGENSNLNVTTTFSLTTVSGITVQDTKYYDQQLGLKITLFNENGDQINGYDLIGVALRYNNIDYYPRVDGSYRINIANRVTNSSANITVKSINSNLSSGIYTIKVEAFGSPDGIYYGNIPPSSATPVNLTVINSLYGLDVDLNSNSKIIDKDTGLNLNDSNVLVFYFNYSSGLSNPQIRVSLKRRDYTNIYSTIYNTVDLKDYVTNALTAAGVASNYEYVIANSPGPNFSTMLNLKTDLVSGTYKFIFSLYENNNYIGEVEEYVVIK